MNFDRLYDPDYPDPDYLRFLADCMKDCRCCGACTIVPCAGVTAGGFCDGFCFCGEGRESRDEENGDIDP